MRNRRTFIFIGTVSRTEEEEKMKRRRTSRLIEKRRRSEERQKKTRRRSDINDPIVIPSLSPTFPLSPLFTSRTRARPRPPSRMRTCAHACMREAFFANGAHLAIWGDLSRSVCSQLGLLVYRVPHAPYGLTGAFLRLYGHYQKLAQNTLHN